MKYRWQQQWYYIDFAKDNLAIKFEEYEYRAKTSRIELMIEDENELSDIIMNHIELLTCFNCGEKLVDQTSYKTADNLGTIHLDPGSCNYPREPDEPANLYCECIKCSPEAIK